MVTLGFQPNKKLPKRPEVCSNHFEENDFTQRANGSKMLRRDAVPYLAVREIGNKSPESDLESTFGIKHKKEQQTTRISEINYQTSSESEKHESEEDYNKLLKRWNTKAESSSSSSTSTASEVEQFLQVEATVTKELSCVERTSMFTEEHGTQSCETTGARNTKHITKLVKRKRRYVGDLNTSDFSSPTKAKKNFKFLKETVLRQRKKLNPCIIL
ncbi:uncharacterized protein [Leptinotarsa decemlineata]|uniref:uncharacterized protein n=1 Tax=Leptinotarsa decemlineata TaxID=7539 RepID=UPI003D30B152